MVKRSLFLSAAVLGVLGLSGIASAASLAFSYNYGNLSGTGKGQPVLGVLSLKEHGSDSTEYGFSGWSQNSGNGAGATLFGTGATPHESWSSNNSQVAEDTTASGFYAQSVGALKAVGVTSSNLDLIFQVNQAGQTYADGLLTSKISVYFINANGSEAFEVDYVPSGNPAPAGSDYAAAGGTTDNGQFPGVGQGTSGWEFNFVWTAAEKAALDTFFMTDGNHIGMEVTLTNEFTNSTDGADNFFFSNVNAPALVPIPAAAWTGMSALAGLGVVGKLRKKLHRD